MSAPDQSAACRIVLDPDGTTAYEIDDHDGRIWRYLIDPVAGDPFAFVVRHVGGGDRYSVCKPTGGLWRCDCKDATYRAKREARSCKHVVCCRALLNNLDHLRPLETTMAEKKKPEAPPAEAPAPEAPQPAAPPSRDAEAERIAAALAAPFEVTEIKFKPQTVSGDRALAIPYVDARVIQDRLDDVVGVMNWQDSYDLLPDGSVVCRLRIRLGDEWIAKVDVGGQSEQPDEGDRRKAAFSDALKRAAVKFGIGRYLYRQKPQWLGWDQRKRHFTESPRLPVAAGGKQAAPAAQQKAAPPGPDFHKNLVAYDLALSERGLCARGDLVKHLAAMGKAKGFPADMSLWTQSQIDAAFAETKAWKAKKEDELRTPAIA